MPSGKTCFVMAVFIVSLSDNYYEAMYELINVASHMHILYKELQLTLHHDQFFREHKKIPH